MSLKFVPELGRAFQPSVMLATVPWGFAPDSLLGCKHFFYEV